LSLGCEFHFGSDPDLVGGKTEGTWPGCGRGSPELVEGSHASTGKLSAVGLCARRKVVGQLERHASDLHIANNGASLSQTNRGVASMAAAQTRPQLLCSLVLLLLGSQTVPSFADGCDGTTEQTHEIGTNYKFVTNAKVEPITGSAYSRYVSCVFNPDLNNDILITWFIPGPYETWVLANHSEPWPRRQPIGPSSVLVGCIEYGNLGERTVAEYTGSDGDAADENKEDEKNCVIKAKGQSAGENKPTSAGEKKPAAAAGEKKQGSNNPIESFKDDFSVYFPSNPSKPHDTMLKMAGNLGIVKKDDTNYLSVMEYTLSQAEGRPDGSTKGIKLRPQFTGAAEMVLPYFKKFHPEEDIQLSDNKEVVFAVSGGSEWRLSSGTYEILDSDNKKLAAIRIPLFVSPQ
jgi:hypothetical protein